MSDGLTIIPDDWLLPATAEELERRAAVLRQHPWWRRLQAELQAYREGWVEGPPPRDTFGDCPTCTTIEWDEDGIFLVRWCSLATWRALNEGRLWKDGVGMPRTIQELREARWLAIPADERVWHEQHYAGSNDAPVFRLKVSA